MPPRCGGLYATIVGDADANLLPGTPFADVIASGGGEDRVAAGNGKDLVCGGAGKDRLNGGKGKGTGKGRGKGKIYPAEGRALEEGAAAVLAEDVAHRVADLAD